MHPAHVHRNHSMYGYPMLTRTCTHAHAGCICRRRNGAATHLVAMWRSNRSMRCSELLRPVAVYKRQHHSSQSPADVAAANTVTSAASALPRVAALSVQLLAVNSAFKVSCPLSQVDRDLFSSITAINFQPDTAMESLKDTAVSFRPSSGNGELPQGGMCVTSPS